MMFAVKDTIGRVLREATVQSMIDDFEKELHIADVDRRLFGVYSPEHNLLSVHISKDGAEKNKTAFERNYKIEGYYVDCVMLRP